MIDLGDVAEGLVRVIARIVLFFLDFAVFEVFWIVGWLSLRALTWGRLPTVKIDYERHDLLAFSVSVFGFLVIVLMIWFAWPVE